MKMLSQGNVQETIPDILPVIPTMDVVVFPHMIVPLLVLDEKIIKGINEAIDSSKIVLLLAANKNVDDEGSIGTKDLYSVGTVASIMRLIKLPEGGVKVLVQGMCKARAAELIPHEDLLSARVERIISDDIDPTELAAQIKNLKAISEKMAVSGQSFSPDFHIILSKMSDPEKISDFVLSHLNLSVQQAQDLLEKQNQLELIEGIAHHLNKEIEVAEIQERIRNRARESMNKSQKEYYLREQIRAIKKELGEDDEEEVALMRQQLEQIDASDEVKKEVTRQINRLERMAPDSIEAAVIRNYLELVLNLPWNVCTIDNLDISHAHDILDAQHYGLEDVKERILDYISVRALKQDGFSPILCLVGPPGTGKTSLGKSIAESLGRKYARISLGGVKDESEIRGHRRTYVGAMPGRFIQAIRKAGSSNPVIIIDELDKLGADFRSDPSAAMLEVLDPHQNKTFYDNYLGVPFDLSKVMFIATANSLDSISEPLRDRMEIIQLSGYTLEEKLHIGREHIVHRAVIDAGLNPDEVSISDAVLEDIIMSYTREAGVRQFERTVRKLCSKAARALVEEHKTIKFNTKNLPTYLGPRPFIDDEVTLKNQVGTTNGLAWTSVGGEMIKIESTLMPGKGKLILTGQLGSVMQESAQAALSYARTHAKKFGIDPKLFHSHDLHIHVPAGAVPKDGPSAGITMLTSILSSYTNRPINAQFAMTGEINLNGEVMPIGGVKEKILAAKRNKIGNVILPRRNQHSIKDIDEVSKGINVIWVDHADDVISKVLVQSPKKKGSTQA